MSMLPSRWASSSSIISSSWDILESSLVFSSLEINFFHWEKMKLMGVSTWISRLIRGALNMANFSGKSLATLLGVISPKISTTTVTTTVERVAPMSPYSFTNSRVAMEDTAPYFLQLSRACAPSSPGCAGPAPSFFRFSRLTFGQSRRSPPKLPPGLPGSPGPPCRHRGWGPG